MDSQTRHALKQDKFVDTTQQGVDWVGEHRESVIRWSIAGVVVLALIIAGMVVYNQRSAGGGGGAGLGAGCVTPRRWLLPGATCGSKGVYATAADRAKAANKQFVQVANQYGWLPEGAKAHYFAGLTYQELGQNGFRPRAS